MALAEARRGSIAPGLCDRGATKPKAIFGATLRAAVLFASRVVARSLQTHGGYARRSRLAGGENPLRRNTSQLGDTTLAVGADPGKQVDRYGFTLIELLVVIAII